ncbi:MAG: heme-binding protein [Candidatus Moranbacteria bacterium]|nr:heme-binding protein [Candidatus Moranbacteria bacterium]
MHTLTSDEAQGILAAAIQTLKAQFKVAAVSIVNRDGTEIAKVVMDGVKSASANVATLKAKQAAWRGKSTAETRDEIGAGKITAEVLGIDPKQLVPWAGGMPIYDKEGNLLGGIGVSNLAQEEDEMVAKSAVCKEGFKVVKA